MRSTTGVGFKNAYVSGGLTVQATDSGWLSRLEGAGGASLLALLSRLEVEEADVGVVVVEFIRVHVAE